MRYEIVLYILKLEDGCYYVGLSANVHKRIDAHMVSRGAVWTRAHPPVGILETKRTWTDDQKSAEEMENRLTIQTMQNYGWRKVRGGWFCNVDETLTEKALRAHGLFDLLEEWEKNCVHRENGRLDYLGNKTNKPNKTDKARKHPRFNMEVREKVTISSVGSCEPATRLGLYEVLMEYNGKSKYLKRDLTDTTVNRCIIQGLIDGVKRLRKPCEVVLVASTSLGLSSLPKLKGPNADILRVLVATLEEKNCVFTFDFASGQGDELRNRIRTGGNPPIFHSCEK